VDEQRREDREDWEQVTCAIGAGFLARWDMHDPDTLEEAVGPVSRQLPAEQELDPAWLG
jgi:hypothetical protein